MKTIFLSVCLLITGLSSNAFSPDTEDPKSEMTKQLSEIVEASSIWDGTKKDFSITVSFTINDNSELVVLTTNESPFDFEIKSLLNYRKMEVSPILINKIFHLPIRIESNL